MKIIDLLNKIANGEEIPETIYRFGEPYYFNEERRTYCDKHDTELGHIVAIDMILNEEVEIIEDKKIEKLDFYEVNGGGDEFDKFYLKNNGQDIFLCTDNDDFEIIVLKKINEIIEELNRRE